MATELDAPLVAIVGETASGKTGLAIELAQRFNGEIIAADSRTVYREMDISTAKPTLSEQQLAKHHLLDVVNPDQRFTAADFKRLAQQSIVEIRSRGHIPFLVGGSGLYVDAALYNFGFRGEANQGLRSKLQQLTIEELQGCVRKAGLLMPRNSRNPRHLIRTLETQGIVSSRQPLAPNVLVLGLTVDRDALRAKIIERVDTMIAQGLFSEIEQIVRKYGWGAPALQASGCIALRPYFTGEMGAEEVKTQFVRAHLRLAKRQRTWFRRNKDIYWICKKEEAVDLITTILNKQTTAMS